MQFQITEIEFDLDCDAADEELMEEVKEYYPHILEE